METNIIPCARRAALINDLKFVFPTAQCFSHAETDKSNNLFAICTCQHAAFDLSRIGGEIEDEKDKLLELVLFRPKYHIYMQIISFKF